MSRRITKINYGTPTDVVNTNFDVHKILVNNPSATNLFIRVGGTDPPNINNWDHNVPAFSIAVLPGLGQQYAFAAATPAFLATYDPNSDAATLPTDTIVIELLSADEADIAVGNINYNTLQLTDFTGGLVAYTQSLAQHTRRGPYDLKNWGGLLVFFKPDPTCPIHWVSILMTPTGSTADAIEVLRMPLYPDTPIMAVIPKIARFARLDITKALPIPTGGAVSGVLSVRATLAEILQPNVISVAGSPSFTNTIGFGSSGTRVIYTPNIESLELGITLTTALATNLVSMVFETSMDGNTWRRISQWNGAIAQSNNLHYVDTFDKLENFFRITFYNRWASANDLTAVTSFYPRKTGSTAIRPRGFIANYFATAVLANVWTKASATASLPAVGKLTLIEISTDIAAPATPYIDVSLGDVTAANVVYLFFSGFHRLDNGTIRAVLPTDGFVMVPTLGEIWVRSSVAGNIYLHIISE